ncbi:hypothetical protein MRY87_09180 [bacterium]|nr:hypothetical protein [bacterium]
MIARVQRNGKVILCHVVWMGNHVHLILIAKDKRECTAFYGEIQKQLTEAMKRLTGRKHLSLWKPNSASVISLRDEETVCYRIAYLYANPARAHLVDTIGEYPGVSSWEEYQRDTKHVDASQVESCFWVRAPMIERLLRAGVSSRQDQRICEKWEEKAKKSHDLELRPNAWMRCFKRKTTEEVQKVNARVSEFHRELEQEAREKREKSGRKVAGVYRLQHQKVTLRDTPAQAAKKQKSRRIFVYSLDEKLRKSLIEEYETFCEKCRWCYERWKHGDYSVKWPPGALYPPAPHTQNDLLTALSPV